MNRKKLIDRLRKMTPEERAKYKQTPAEKAEAANRRREAQEAKAERIREMYKKNPMAFKEQTKKKTGGKVVSKKKVKKDGAPHNRLY
jgi:hypothetical protein